MNDLEWYEMPDSEVARKPEVKVPNMGVVMKEWSGRLDDERQVAESAFASALNSIAQRHNRSRDKSFTKYLEAYGPQFKKDFIACYESRVMTAPKWTESYMTEAQFVAWVEEQFLNDRKLIGWNESVTYAA